MRNMLSLMHACGSLHLSSLHDFNRGCDGISIFHLHFNLPILNNSSQHNILNFQKFNPFQVFCQNHSHHHFLLCPGDQPATIEDKKSECDWTIHTTDFEFRNFGVPAMSSDIIWTLACMMCVGWRRKRESRPSEWLESDWLSEWVVSVRQKRVHLCLWCKGLDLV